MDFIYAPSGIGDRRQTKGDISMNADVHFQVSDVLKTKYFAHAKVLAGEKGLFRQVKWVHVLEVPAVEDLLNGESSY